MKAIVYEKYGPPDVMELREIDRPGFGDDEVLVRVHAAGVTAGDWHLLTATWFVVRLFCGLFRPRRPVLGFDVAGTVEQVGARVTRFQPGDAVFGSYDKTGAFAEFMRIPEDHIAAKPERISFEQAGVVATSAYTALQGLRDHGRIRAGHRVLVNGASGGVGGFAVQIAKHFGAEVTGVCSGPKMDLVRSFGADHVIDYAERDFTASDAHYDLVFDLVGNRPLRDCKRALEPNGTYVAASGSPGRSVWVAIAGGKRAVSYVSKPNQTDLQYLRELLVSGELKPVIDRSYPLEQTPDALRYFGAGKVRGKVVITV